MLNSTLSIEETDCWVSEVQTSEYLHRIEVVRQAPSLGFLRDIISGTLAHIPFQNLAMLIDERIRPSPAQICADMVSGRGGICMIRNPFLFHLFLNLGFKVRYVTATMEKPDCHIALIVTIEGDDWWIDAGNGFPYQQPIRLGDSEPVKHPFLQYRLIVRGNRWEIQHQRDDEWKRNYDFSSEGSTFSVFDRMYESHYVPGWGPFLIGLRINRWWGDDYVILRDNRATSPDGEEVLESPQEIQAWIEKWFPKSGFLDSVNVIEACEIWKFGLNQYPNAECAMENSS